MSARSGAVRSSRQLGLSGSARGVLRALLLVAVAAGTLGVGVAVAASAQAHNVELSISPVRESTVTEPISAIIITFNDVILGVGESGESSIVRLTGPNGRFYETACGITDGRVVTTAVALGPAGLYSGSYRVVSADGHPISADFSFSYQPADDAVSAAGADAGSASPICQDDGSIATPDASTAPEQPTATEPDDTPAPPKTAQPESAAESAGFGVWTGALIGGGVALLLVAAVLYLALRRPARDTP